MTNSTILSKYITFLKINRSASEQTIKNYVKDIQHFCDILNFNINDIDHLKKISNDDIKTWLINRKENTTNRTISRNIVAIKMFFLFLNEIYNIKNDTMLNLNGLKFKNGLPKAIDGDKIINIIDNLGNIIKYKNTFELERDKLIFITLFATGLRISELLSLTQNDFLKDNFIIFGKGKKERIVPILPIIKQQYQNYLLSIKDNNIIPQDKVFFNLKNKILSARDVNRIFQQIKVYYGFQCFSPHILRHSFATSLLENGANIKEIQTLLGHENLATTQKYTKITKKMLSNKLKKINW